MRSVTLSAPLAQQCAVVRYMLNIPDQDDQVEEALPQHLEGMTVPGVPDGIPTAGLQLLNDWAIRSQQELSAGRGASDWLPAFLAAHQGCVDGAAAEAADFLGCRTFLDLVLGVQLLKVVLLDGSKLEALLERTARTTTGLGANQPAEEPPKLVKEDVDRELTQEQLRLLPCMRSSSSSPVAAVAATVAAAAVAAPAPAATGADGAQSTPPWRRSMPLERFEKLVTMLCNSPWIAVTNPSAEAVRRGLTALGLVPTLRASTAHDKNIHDGKIPYMDVPVQALPHYEATAIVVEVDSHDQGWSSYPQDRETYRNSWTWGELVLLAPDGAPVRPGDPGRLYTNLHAVSRWQTHRVTLGRDSQVVQDINEKVMGAGAAAASAGVEGADAKVTTATAAAAEEEEEADQGQQGYKLQLLQCAAFPGWVNHIRRAEITVELQARPVDPLAFVL